MGWYVASALILIATIGGYYQIKSIFYLAPGYENQKLRVFTLGIFAQKVFFSDEGWTYRKRGFRTVLLAVTIGVVLTILDIRGIIDVWQ